MNRTLALAFMLVVGCLAGTTASQLMAPPARAAGPVQKWEYFCPEDADVAALNRFGAEGWELVTMVGQATMGGEWFRYCMKRPY